MAPQPPKVAADLDQGALAIAHTSLDILRMVEERDPGRRATAPQLRRLLDGRATLPRAPSRARL